MAHELDELTPKMDEHLHYAITEYFTPTHQGNHETSKLALLWMVKDKGKK